MPHDYLNFVSDIDLKMTSSVQKMALSFKVFENIIGLIVLCLILLSRPAISVNLICYTTRPIGILSGDETFSMLSILKI